MPNGRVDSNQAPKLSFLRPSLEVCSPTSIFESANVCGDNSYCCGVSNNECCTRLIPSWQDPPDRSQAKAMEAVSGFIVMMSIVCCCVCCYRCCCRRTTSRGFVYSTPGPTTVAVSLPPNQSQQMPYPTVVPYPQQTPYPPQYNPPHNPYYGMPPPAYGVAVQSGNQQASAPSAPFVQS
ncbi:protein shisa-5-like isoform X2 [Macrosteles quadrilineatus]|uniref:protein shisa-5-like isoform X2 n=1 Tax=Macrosteles quadrilineatus TaxID=74068 RepID=UPI0023E258A8|nr:protein shisa-5-like isoform X2 [Macrosteles quadrilineatus]